MSKAEGIIQKKSVHTNALFLCPCFKSCRHRLYLPSAPTTIFYHRPRTGSIGLARPAVGFLSPVHPSPVRRHRCRPPKQTATIRRSVPTLSLVKLRPLAHILRQKFRQLIQPRRSRSLFMTASAERRRNRRYVHIVFHRAERQIPFAAFV